MDIEVFSYTLVSTVIGLLVVFSFLAFLAVVMVILGKWDMAKAAKAEKKAASAAPKADNAAAPEAAESMDWLIAAVAAFVAQDEEPVSAEAWTPSEYLNNPWAKAPRVSKRLSGVNR